MHIARRALDPGVDELTRRRPYHHGNLREALVAAGLQLTRAGGPSALALRDVTRQVGVSPNAAYRHFVDPAALLAAVAERIHAQVAATMGAAEPAPAGLGPAEQAVARLRAVGLGYVDFALSEPGWFEVAFTRPGPPRPVTPATGLLAETVAAPSAERRQGPDAASLAPPEAWPAAFGALADALDGLVATGLLHPDARPGAEWPCWSAVHGFTLLALQGPLGDLPTPALRRAAEQCVDAIVRGVLAG